MIDEGTWFGDAKVRGRTRLPACKWGGWVMCMQGRKDKGSVIGGTQACWPGVCLGLVSRLADVGLVGSEYGVSLTG